MRKLEGVFPPIPTPFDASGKILHDKLISNLARWNETGLHGYVVLGSNGEYVMLNESERAAVWETARAAIPRDRLFFAGTGAESTSTAIALTKRAAELGADAAMVVTPHYYKSQMNGQTLINHYRVIADASPIPIILYNFPPSTGIDLDAPTVLQLAQHPNIVGIKDSSGNITKFAEIVRGASSDFALLAGSGAYFYPSLCVGATGCVPALGNIAPRECVALFDAFRAGRHEEAREIQLRVIALNAAITSKWSVPGLKAALDELNFYGGPPRLPLRSLGTEDRHALKELMKQAGVC
jgi:4-hydroxy-tetrahydrodipicolinate synthase